MRLRVFILKLFVVGLLLPMWCAAVQPYVPEVADPILEPWRWREAEEFRGLGVLCMDESLDGTLWFGFIGGLAEYDGRTVKRYYFSEVEGGILPQFSGHPAWADSVLCLADGGLLVVIESSLFSFKDGEWAVVLPTIGPTSFEVDLFQNDDGAIWLLTPDALWHLSPDLTEQEAVLRTGQGSRLTAMCEDTQGNIWVVRNDPLKVSELIHIPLQEGRPVQEPLWAMYRIDGESPGRESSICEGADGRIWYVDNSGENNIRALTPESGTWEEIDEPDVPKGFFSLIKDGQGTLWACGSGLLYAIREPANGYYSPGQLGLSRIPLKIFQASDDSWWIIGRGGYVYTVALGYKQWRTYIGLHFQCDDGNGKEWYISATRKVVRHSEAMDDWGQFSPADGVIDRPRSIHRTKDGLIWAIGSHHGRAAVSIYNGLEWVRHEHRDFALMIGENSFFEDEEGAVWLGAMGDRLQDSDRAGGVLKYTADAEGTLRLSDHLAPPSIPYSVARIVLDREGLLWLGSPSVRYYNTTSGECRMVSDLPTVFTQDMVLDREGELWVSKGLFGIYRKEQDRWKSYSVEGEMAGNLINDLLPLKDGTLLAASDKGISRFDGRAWSALVFGKDFGMSSRDGSIRQSAKKDFWFNYTAQDARSPRVTMNLRNKEQFCTVRYTRDRHAPSAFIDPHVDQVDSAGNIHVSWSGYDFHGNTPADRLEYSWRLNGGTWSLYSRKTGKTFLDLARGKHTLEVRARDRDFNVDPTPAESWFLVIPAVWQRPWFIAMVLFIVVGTLSFIGMLIYFHDRRLQEQQRHLVEIDQVKTGFFTNISHELNSPLGLIRIPLERLMEKLRDPESEKLLDMAMRNVDRVSNLVSQILDFRLLEQGRIQICVQEGDIAMYLRETLELLLPLAKRKQISYDLGIPEQCIGWFDRDKLKKMVSNLFNNAVKYTGEGGHIRIVFHCRMTENDGRVLELVIEDNGRGIKPEHLSHIFDRFYRTPEQSIVDGSGIGLNLTKELVDLWGGKIRAESPVFPLSVNPGTQFVIGLPIDRENILNQGDSI